MKKAFWIKPIISAVIIILLATDCKKTEEQVAITKSDSNSNAKSDSIFYFNSDTATPGNLPYIWQSHVLDITSSTITFCVGIKTNNLPTVVYFKYGPQCADYRDSVLGTIRTDCCNDPVNGYFEYVGTATGLKSSTDYYWSDFATNSAGTTPDQCYRCCTSEGKPDDNSTLPAGKTLAATNISENGATLNGTVNGYGLPTFVTFEYGTSTDYGLEITAEQSPIEGITDSNVSAVLTGLTGGTNYYYRVKAVNTSGTFYGDNMIFNSANLPVLTTSPASDITPTSAISGGNITDDGGAAITDRGVYYSMYQVPPIIFREGIISNHTHDGPGTGRFISSLTGLYPHTTYHILAYAVNSAGSAYGDIITFTTPPPPILCDQVPIVTTSAATNISSTGATLNGTVNANGSSVIVTFEYQKFVQIKGGGIWTWKTVTATQSPITGTTLTNVSAVVTDLRSGTKHPFRVKAENSCGTVYGENLSFTLQ